MPWGCPGYLVADPKTKLAALVDPELEMVESMLDAVFEHALRPAYVIDTHTHADHVFGARELASKSVAKIVSCTRRPRLVPWTSGWRTGTGFIWASFP